MNNKEKCVIEFEKGAVKERTVVLVMVLLLTGIFIWALAVGGSRIGLREVYRSVIDSISGSETVSETQKYIALSIRIPRVLAAMEAGAALAMAGLLMQGVFQNPLVSPYTLGISNGASFGACLAIIAVSGGESVFAGI